MHPKLETPEIGGEEYIIDAESISIDSNLASTPKIQVESIEMFSPKKQYILTRNNIENDRIEPILNKTKQINSEVIYVMSGPSLENVTILK